MAQKMIMAKLTLVNGAMIIVWAKTVVAWMERSLRSVIQVLLAEMMIMAQDCYILIIL